MHLIKNNFPTGGGGCLEKVLFTLASQKETIKRGDFLDETLKTEVPCQSSYNTIKIPPCKELHFAALRLQWWGPYRSELINESDTIPVQN